MSNIYIAFVDTPGFFASIIRRVINQRYIHVAIGLDETMEEAYSIGRRNPAIPFFAGFVKEDKEKILKKFPDAGYKVCRVSCSEEQREYIRNALHEMYLHRFRYHYTILGLPLILFQKPFEQRYYHTCSSFLARLFEDAGIWRWKKHTSIVTPRDFYEELEKEEIFEGPLYELVYPKATVWRKVYEQ